MFNFFTKKLDKAKAFSLALETITDKGVFEVSELEVGDRLLGYDFVGDKGEALNKVEKITKVSAHGRWYCINEKVLLFENQSIVANGNVTHAKFIKKGDKLVGIGGKEIIVESVTRIIGKYHFFRMVVETNHTYFLNGILMHNASRYWVGGAATWSNVNTASWSATDGGAGGASVPTSVDDAFFNGNSGGGLIGMQDTTGNKVCLSLSFVGFTGSVSAPNTNAGINVWGSLNCGTTMTNTSGMRITLLSTSSGNTITCGGKAGSWGLSFNGVGGVWTLQDDWTNGGSSGTPGSTWILLNGTIDANGKAVTIPGMNNSASATRVLTMGGGLWTLTGASGANIWNMNATGLTFNKGASNIKLTAYTSTVTWAGGGLTYNDVWFQGNTTQAVTVTGSNTFGDLKWDCLNAALACTLTAGTTQTCTTFTVTGTLSTKKLTIISSSAGSAASISVASGNVVVSQCSIKDNTATGGANFNAVNSINVSGNTGWNFTNTFPQTPMQMKQVRQAVNRASTY